MINVIINTSLNATVRGMGRARAKSLSDDNFSSACAEETRTKNSGADNSDENDNSDNSESDPKGSSCARSGVACVKMETH